MRNFRAAVSIVPRGGSSCLALGHPVRPIRRIQHLLYPVGLLGSRKSVGFGVSFGDAFSMAVIGSYPVLPGFALLELGVEEQPYVEF